VFVVGTEFSFSVPIAVAIQPTPSTASPFGSFDTSSSGSTVAGSIAVTGWALDDIGIDRVELWRDRVSGETTPPFSSTPTDPRKGKVFIANATFVPGARPDIEAAYVTVPASSRAGWGYLMLTYGLWNRGNGTYTLYAFAFDQDAHVTTLGAKTITSNNAAATKPFGALDTPDQGATVSGTLTNFGWALTPGTTCTVAGGGVQVSIDSGPLQPVTYGGARADIAGAFPGYTDANAAGGSYTLNAPADRRVTGRDRRRVPLAAGSRIPRPLRSRLLRQLRYHDPRPRRSAARALASPRELGVFRVGRLDAGDWALIGRWELRSWDLIQ
jgi:hypothetical protein